MTREEDFFKENFPEYVTEKGEFLSPYWDLFRAGVICDTFESKVKIEQLEKLKRIKEAYYSGLKVQIWFNGYWENFDARDYSMYADPFSENRQYRIVGSAYADIAEKRIKELEKENTELKALIEKMKCCSNCNHFNKESDIEYCQNCERHLVNSLDNFPREEIIKDEWELRR